MAPRHGSGEVIALDPRGRHEVIAKVPAMPMGNGWLPDGSMLTVSSLDGRLLRRAPDGSLVTHADLTGLSRYPWSDMVVDRRGNAYIGNIGFDFAEGSRKASEPAARTGRFFITAAVWEGLETLGNGRRTGQVLTTDVAVPGIGSP